MSQIWETYNDGCGPDLEMSKLRQEGSWDALDVWMHANSRYRPGSLKLPNQIIINKGTGSLLINGQTYLYAPKHEFWVPAGVEHCFSLVRTETVITRRWQLTEVDKDKIQKLVERILARYPNLIP